jgi:hypothetical protein
MEGVECCGRSVAPSIFLIHSAITTARSCFILIHISTSSPINNISHSFPGSITTANGSSLVRLGNTTVVVGVKAEIAEPELDREEEGFLVPNIDLPALCSPRFKPGPPTEEAQILGERLNEVLIG